MLQHMLTDAGVQKKHVLNMLAMTNCCIPWFLFNIYTKVSSRWCCWGIGGSVNGHKHPPTHPLTATHTNTNTHTTCQEARVNATYTANKVMATVNQLPNAFALCTDSAAVMRKAWRIVIRAVQALSIFRCKYD